MLNIIYPPLCLYCNAYLEKDKKIFCIRCLQSLVWIDPNVRCEKCFLDIGCNCCKKSNPFKATASVVQYNPLSAILISKLKYSGHFYLSSAIAALMAKQFVNLQWPNPDIVTYIPMNFSKFIKRGFNQSALIAKKFSKILGFKYQKTLIKSAANPSQASLNLSERKQSSISFKPFNSRLDLSEKKVLIIDDVMTTQMTLFHAAYPLKELNCKSLYALTFSRTEMESLLNH